MAQIGNLVELFAGQERTEAVGFTRGEWSQNLWNEGDGAAVRAGFGQVAQLDTTLGLNLDEDPPVGSAPAYGYTEHLGTATFETPFDTVQVLSVFYGRVSTSSIGAEESNAQWSINFFVRIYDVTTDRHFEEVLYTQTSEFENNLNSLAMSEWYGSYETNKTFDNRKFLAGRDTEFYFQVMDGYVFFGSAATGLSVYRPADFRQIREQWVEDSETNEYSSGYSESTLITRLALVDGSFADSQRYLRNSELGTVVAIDEIQGRMIFVSGNSIYFSDPFRPNAIMSQNVVRIPTENKLTAVKAIKDRLLVFTDRETFIYSPSNGTLASQGRLIRSSDSVGCISPNTVIRAEDRLFWVSKNGVFTTTSGAGVEEIGKGIRNFFTSTGLVTNPLTSFFETVGGYTSIAGEQPRTTISLEDEKISMAYSSEKETLLIAFPKLNSLWCYSKGWSFWPVESMVYVSGGVPAVGVQQNLVNPWITYADQEFYLTVGVEAQSLTDAGYTVAEKYNSGNQRTVNAVETSYSICRLGLGGALDRSVDEEDYRLFPRKYMAASIVSSDPSAAARMAEGIFYFRPPVYDYSDGSYWIPVEAVPPTAGSVGNIRSYLIRFQFDYTNYDARPSGAPAAITIRLPPERTGVTVTSFTCSAAGVASLTGQHIQVACTAGADMQMTKKNTNPLFWFNLLPRNTSTTSSFGIKPITPQALMADSAGNTREMNVFVYCPYKVSAERQTNDANAQPVDWGFKSKNKEQQGTLLRARGLFTEMASRGSTLSSDGQLDSNWAWGIFNVLLGSDRKPYTTQIVDIDQTGLPPNITRIVNKQTLRTRFKNVAGNMALRIFGTDANVNPTWGKEGTAAAGNYLVDDTQVDNIAVSDSVKGEELSYTVFGFMRGRADGLIIKHIKANLRAFGKRRRTGR